MTLIDCPRTPVVCVGGAEAIDLLASACDSCDACDDWNLDVNLRRHLIGFA